MFCCYVFKNRRLPRAMDDCTPCIKRHFVGQVANSNESLAPKYTQHDWLVMYSSNTTPLRKDEESKLARVIHYKYAYHDKAAILPPLDCFQNKPITNKYTQRHLNATTEKVLVTCLNGKLSIITFNLCFNLTAAKNLMLMNEKSNREFDCFDKTKEGLSSIYRNFEDKPPVLNLVRDTFLL